MLPTRDHGAILEWGLRNGATPAEVRTLKFDGEPSRLHFLFGKAATGTPELHPITWEDFFARFDLLHLSVALDPFSPCFQIVRVEADEGPLDHH